MIKLSLKVEKCERCYGVQFIYIFLGLRKGFTVRCYR